MEIKKIQDIYQNMTINVLSLWVTYLGKITKYPQPLSNLRRTVNDVHTTITTTQDFNINVRKQIN